MADTKVGIALAVSGAAQAQRDLTLVESSLGRLTTFANNAGKLLGGIGGALVVREILQGFNQIVSGMEKIYETSQKVGMSTEALSGLKYAAEQSGVGFDQLTTGLAKFSKAIAEARSGSKEYAEVIKQLGIAAGDNAEQALAKVADRFARMPDGIEKTALAMKLFGRAGADLIPFLNEGSDGLAALRDEAERLGVVLDGEAAAAADAFGDNLDKLKTAAVGVGTALVSDMLPGLVDITNAMAIAAKQGEGLVGVLSALANSAERLLYFGSGAGGADAALVEAEAKLRDLEQLEQTYTRIRDGLESEPVTSQIRRTVVGMSITEQLESLKDSAAKAREKVSELRGETAGYVIAEEKAAQVDERRAQALTVTVTATEKKAAATKKSAGASKSLADAEAKHATEVERTLNALQLENVELTQGARARYEMELATKGWTEAERDAALAIYDQNEALKAAKESGDEYGKIMERVTERVTDAFSEFFTSVFRDGVKSFKNLVDAIKDLFFRLLGDLMTAAIANPIKIALGLGGTGTASAGGLVSSAAGSAGSGFLSSMIGNPITSLLGGVTGFSSALGSGVGALGSALFGGAPAGLLGTAGNLLSFGTAGLGSGTMAGMAAGLGSIASVALPVIGIIGAIAGLAGAFRDKPDNEWFRFYSGSRGSKDSMAPLASGMGAFGAFGVSGNEDLRGENEGPFSQKVVELVGQIDAQIAQYLTQAQIDAAKAAINGQVLHSASWREGKSGDPALAGVLKARYVALFGAVDAQIAQVVANAANTTEAVGTAAVLASLKLGIKQFTGTPAAAAPDALSAQAQLTASATAIRGLLAGMDNTVEAHQSLLQAVQERYQLELAYLTQIKQLGEQIKVSFTGLREQILLTNLTPQQTYDYWKDKVNTTLIPQLATTTDPARIAELVAQIQSVTGTAWQTRGADQAEQEAKKAEFLAFLTDAEALAQQRLATAEQAAKAESDALRVAVANTMNQLLAAAANLNAAAANLRSATSSSTTLSSGYNAATFWSSDGVGYG